ncbi:GPI transamidase subunit PIG-U [Ancylostoma caninum]|uniref:GPI transamidase subunit PIG-U n=1 Tax=Ancylostoma caninum TaxID=29170 RepID=A0A368GU59_ANCCA|nr:GPI transamidase subunit PIG-U [Ancylostoma caninum]
MIGMAVRVLCFIYARPFLMKRAELTSPLVSYRRLKDGVAMYKDGVSPYEGDLFHFQPFLLRLFSIANVSEEVMFALFVAVDCLTAMLLSTSAGRYATENGSSHPEHIAQMVLKCYLLNPITAACSAVLSISVLHNFIAAAIVYFFSIGLLFPCVALLSVSASLSLYPVVILASVLLRFPTLQERLQAVGGLAVGFTLMVLLNWLLNGRSWSFIEDTYGFILKVDDLTPNVGLVWYFFMQVFEHFRAFYLAVFQINLLVYVVPLLLSLRKDAHLHLVVSLLLVAVFSSYPTLNDASVYLALLPMLEKYRKYPRYTLVVGGAIVTCIVLMPVMWHMWIVAGSGNANFYFAVTLIYNVAQIYLMIDLMFAYFRKEADEISASLVTPKTNFVLH